MEQNQNPSKKRNLNQFQNQQNDSQETNVNYQQQNQILRELALERMQRQQQQTQKSQNNCDLKQNYEQQNKEQDQIQTQKTQVIIKNKNDIQQEEEQKISIQKDKKSIDKQNEFQNIHTQKLTQFYVNKLVQYPVEQHADYMVSFDELFLEDPFYKLRNKEKIDTVQSVFITTYGFQSSQLEKIVKGKQTHFVLANDRSAQDKKEGLPDVIENFKNYKNWTLIHPPKDYSSPFPGPFHPKLWLLKFPKFLRVVICSANQMEADWDIWGQGVWFQDFRVKNQGEKECYKTLTDETKFDFDKDFKITLEHFVSKIMPPFKDYKELLKIDLNDYFYENINVILIPGLPGRFQDDQFKKYNKGKVKHVLTKYFKNSSTKLKDPILTYQSTSCGSIDEQFIEEMLNTFNPHSQSFQVMNDDRKNRKKNKLEPIQFSKDFKFVYPTLQYILNEAQAGVEFAGCLCMQKDSFVKESFPKLIMHRYEGNQEYFFYQGVIPHIKGGILTERDGSINDNTVIYLGSHNFSQAAWGRLQLQMKQININNTELGILFPPQENSKQMKQQIVNVLPWKFPPEKYQGNDRPFMWADCQN
ncbi:hypothetical protein PPERSA_00856 [Pseudocohnilembus persalinus]|uniref:Uncharacterized protein n=1 Tax=Pseudocohnilembus persalinus TaxID=266149 RepID=A0A0V0QEJ9_PSEPJ|nr:hypothetical protein PPERSA_00856 [Pseudocohnilembus persalinus]|eukprot:KRX00629.1 hypothetical protein PPERSA_00856 [Pseudocohnilembus persalinus]